MTGVVVKIEAWCDPIERAPRDGEDPAFRYYENGPVHYAIDGVEVTRDEALSARVDPPADPAVIGAQ